MFLYAEVLRDTPLLRLFRRVYQPTASMMSVPSAPSGDMAGTAFGPTNRVLQILAIRVFGEVKSIATALHIHAVVPEGRRSLISNEESTCWDRDGAVGECGRL